MSHVEHPDWCHPAHCEATDPNLPLNGGRHRSAPIDLDLRIVTTNHGVVSRSGTGTTYLTQAACPWTTATYLHIQADDTDLSLPLPQAAGILAQLTQLVHQPQ